MKNCALWGLCLKNLAEINVMKLLKPCKSINGLLLERFGDCHLSQLGMEETSLNLFFSREDWWLYCLVNFGMAQSSILGGIKLDYFLKMLLTGIIQPSMAAKLPQNPNIFHQVLLTGPFQN